MERVSEYLDLVRRTAYDILSSGEISLEKLHTKKKLGHKQENRPKWQV